MTENTLRTDLWIASETLGAFGPHHSRRGVRFALRLSKPPLC